MSLTRAPARACTTLALALLATPLAPLVTPLAAQETVQLPARDRSLTERPATVYAIGAVRNPLLAEQRFELTPAGLPAREGESPLVGEVVLEAAPGYCFGDTASGDAVLGPPKYRGTHGQRPEHPDNLAFFLAAGPGIRRAVAVPSLTSRDVAPTLAHVLGVPLDLDPSALTPKSALTKLKQLQKMAESLSA